MMINETERERRRKAFLADLIKQAISDQQRGDLAGTEARCQSILAMDPGNADALHLLGVVHHQTGKTNTAIDLIGQAIRNCPANPCYHNSLGSSLRSSLKLAEAKQSYKKALYLKPDYPEALYNLAVIFHLEKRFDQALACYKKALEVNDRFPEALNNMAAALNITEKYKEAVDCCKKAIRIRSNFSEAYNNMGNAYKGLGRPASAVRCYERAITLGGENAEVLCNLANALQETDKLDKAIATYEKAIRLNPVYGKAYNNLGTAYRAKRNLEVAKRLFEKSIRLAPKDAQGYHNLGNVFYDLGDLGAAASWYEKAISVHPESVPTYINLGIVYQESGQSNKALQCFNKALALDPHNSKVHSHLIHGLYQGCDWRQIDALSAKIDSFTELELANGQRPNEMPFLSLIRSADPQKNLRVAKGWSRAISQSIMGNKNGFVHAKERLCNKRLTIGYLSNNFRNHPTSHLIGNIFEGHDRSRFAVNAYSYGEDDGSLYRQYIQQDADRFVDICHCTHEDAAGYIIRDEVDILIDLVGYMRGNRLEICAYRPAPVQVRWLGLAGTTGADFFDYIIADRTVIPEDHAIYYSEKPVYMPDCYQMNSKPITASERMFTRSELGLPVDGFVYCCFCSNYKIDPVIFAQWMEILRNVPDSVLWLLKSNTIVEGNLKREASEHGVDSQRLVFADKIDRSDHLARIKCADLALDTRIVNGAATTSDALFAGVPVITLQGGHFASRMAASINRAIGLDDLVTQNLSDYLAFAIALGKSRRQFDTFKERLRTNITIKPLFNPSRFVRNLEKAYLEMWNRHYCGKRPEMIRINQT